MFSGREPNDTKTELCFQSSVANYVSMFIYYGEKSRDLFNFMDYYVWNISQLNWK